MIDFAHVIKTTEHDFGYQTGINNLLNFLGDFVTFSVEDYRKYMLEVFSQSNGEFPEFSKSPKTTKKTNLFKKKKSKEDRNYSVNHSNSEDKPSKQQTKTPRSVLASPRITKQIRPVEYNLNGAEEVIDLPLDEFSSPKKNSSGPRQNRYSLKIKQSTDGEMELKRNKYSREKLFEKRPFFQSSLITTDDDDNDYIVVTPKRHTTGGLENSDKIISRDSSEKIVLEKLKLKEEKGENSTTKQQRKSRKIKHF